MGGWTCEDAHQGAQYHHQGSRFVAKVTSLASLLDPIYLVDLYHTLSLALCFLPPHSSMQMLVVSNVSISEMLVVANITNFFCLLLPHVT